jgi:hypothetical protein
LELVLRSISRVLELEARDTAAEYHDRPIQLRYTVCTRFIAAAVVTVLVHLDAPALVWHCSLTDFLCKHFVRFLLQLTQEKRGIGGAARQDGLPTFRIRCHLKLRF